MLPRETPLSTILAEPRRVVFMDCDGIIFNTNQSKCDAFRHALTGYPSDAVETLVAHHMATGGVSRYVKLKRFFAELHPVADPESAVATAVARFGAFSEAAYANLQPRAESLAFAAHFARMATHDGVTTVHVISGSDGDELRRVFTSHGLDSRFASVCGSPDTKITHITRILAACGATPAEALFIGDGGGDWQAALELGLPFILLREMSEWHDGEDVVRTTCAMTPADMDATETFPISLAHAWRDILLALPDENA